MCPRLSEQHRDLRKSTQLQSVRALQMEVLWENKMRKTCWEWCHHCTVRKEESGEEGGQWVRWNEEVINSACVKKNATKHWSIIKWKLNLQTYASNRKSSVCSGWQVGKRDARRLSKSDRYLVLWIGGRKSSKKEHNQERNTARFSEYLQFYVTTFISDSGFAQGNPLITISTSNPAP